MVNNKQRLKCDLHIHSCLSPCADILMTPGNIIKKALELGLDIIAISDHNTAGNVKVAIDLAADFDLKIIPAMEIESSEEVHLLCYFENLEKLHIWNEIVGKAMPDLKNDEETFGYQLITDQRDEYVAKEERLLASATKLTVKEIFNKVRAIGGSVVPSHLDRPYNSLLANLGFIPEDLDISVVELSKNAIIDKFFAKYPFIKKYPYIVSSDSHYLKDIKAYTEIDVEEFKDLLGIDLNNTFS